MPFASRGKSISPTDAVPPEKPRVRSPPGVGRVKTQHLITPLTVENSSFFSRGSGGSTNLQIASQPGIREHQGLKTQRARLISRGFLLILEKKADRNMRPFFRGTSDEKGNPGLALPAQERERGGVLLSS